jgi:arylsulfatase A-like enzyme
LLKSPLDLPDAEHGTLTDVRLAVAAATGGAISFAILEYVLTLWSYAGRISFASKVRFTALVVALSTLLWLALTAASVIVVLSTHAVRRLRFGREARRPRCFVVSITAGGVRPGVARLWGGVVTGALMGVSLQQVAALAIAHYKEPQLTAGLIACVSLVITAIGIPFYGVVSRYVHGVAGRLAPSLHAANPFGRLRAAGVLLSILLGGTLEVVWASLPQSRSVLPVRLILSATAIALGMGLGVKAGLDRRVGVGSRLRALGGTAAACAFMMLILRFWGADLEAKYVAITASPALDGLIRLVRAGNDFDRDGYGSLLGENDCAPFNASIHPGAVDLPDDGVDQNCDGHDFTMRAAVRSDGPRMHLPPQFARDWNVLLLTVDATRYDHTTFGGYADSPKHRDTTPRMAELAKSSTSFSFCNAPSAGTMASIPAILTSKYFHSGIALNENVPLGAPPKLLPENTTLPEIMKRVGYTTGVVGSHEYWNDWGLDQGVDDYDNEIGRTPDPFRVCADKVTDHVLAWVSRQKDKKWFMWAHYIDPHGRYVAHPEVVDYGSTLPDLYDAEIQWTDREIGRLLDELKRLPSWDHTVVVITSDHGDSMGEHNVPVGNHATALYYELQHVPLVFYVPDNPPRVIGGAVSNLDIVPTLAELCGIDVHDLSFEGTSLVPQIFYGEEDHERIVFAETNLPGKQRAAISESWKLIYYLNSNLYELFDLKNDPAEHQNLAPDSPPAMAKMKAALDGWLERVMFARDPEFNQEMRRIGDVLLPSRPTPEVSTTGQTLDHGNLEVLGIGVAAGQRVSPGRAVDVHVYLTAHQRTAIPFRMMLIAWPVDAATFKTTDPTGPDMVYSHAHVTADGMFATDRWRPNEFVRERFSIAVSSEWKTNAIAIGLIVEGPDDRRVVAEGAAAANDRTIAVLGLLPLGSGPGGL